MSKSPRSQVIIDTVPVLNPAARAVAWALSKVSPVCDAGVFHIRGSRPVIDAWREGQSLTLRLGLVEFVVDLKRVQAGATA